MVQAAAVSGCFLCWVSAEGLPPDVELAAVTILLFANFSSGKTRRQAGQEPVAKGRVSAGHVRKKRWGGFLEGGWGRTLKLVPTAAAGETCQAEHLCCLGCTRLVAAFPGL